ncbi:M24 family metallopeptidase [Shimazuella kribbensis]|uniref:M24 family metallopeptidase n=1 Tax=Shimazuella kribbensis TaxID=139808 RepID=UPI0004215BBA|nr:Xaa-Pro peptidase family protein [Shimazuella kribbensis]
MNTRIDQLTDWMRLHKVDAAFLTSSANVFYLTGFSCDPHERLLGVWVFPDQEPFLVCPLLELDRVKASGWSKRVYAHRDGENTWAWMKENIFSDASGLNVAVEEDHLTYGRASRMQMELGISNLVAIDEQIRTMRMVKDKKELQILKEAAKFADKAIQYGIASLKVGCTELQVKNHIEQKLREDGITHMAFETMVLFGERTALPHGEASNVELRDGDFVLFDLGVVVEEYRSDITRTVIFGSASKEQQKIYETVLGANEQAIDLLKQKNAKTFGELDQVARNHIARAGYGAYFTHRLGHGLGLEAHEYPSVSENNELPLQTGVVFTVEPGVYVPHIGGVRIEDMVYITEEGCEILTSFPKNLQVVSP